MEKFWEKFDQYLFDIVGILLPGIVGCIILLFLKGITFELLNSFLSTIENHFIPIALFFLFSFLLGHVIKFGSITYYAVATPITEVVFTFLKKLLWVLKKILWPVRSLFFCFKKNIRDYLNKFQNKISYNSFLTLCSWYRKLYFFLLKEGDKILKPIKRFYVENIFRHKIQKYGSDYQPIENYVIQEMKKDSELSNLRFDDKTKLNNAIYKISDILSRNENIKSLWHVHLAKYNCYRSLAFLFLFTYLICTFPELPILKNFGFINVPQFLSAFLLVFFFTFHYKFKRYWQLCSTEALNSLFYYYYSKKP